MMDKLEQIENMILECNEECGNYDQKISTQARTDSCGNADH